jgi:1,4-alpha-glucan branching enzyme
MLRFKNIQPVSERFPALEEQETILTFFVPEAREVKVAGSFNRWCPDATPLNNTGSGKWAVRLMLRSGQYEYRFVVDGGGARIPGHLNAWPIFMATSILFSWCH